MKQQRVSLGVDFTGRDIWVLSEDIRDICDSQSTVEVFTPSRAYSFHYDDCSAYLFNLVTTLSEEKTWSIEEEASANPF